MADWQPIDARPRSRRGQQPGVVRLAPSGTLSISTDLCERFRPHHAVQPVMNGDASKAGLRGAPARSAVYTLNLSGKSGAARLISAMGLLSYIGKRPPRQALDIPHSWDGDVLVLDLSSLPDAGGE